MDNEGAIYVSKRVYILDYPNRNVSINDRICCWRFCVVVYVSCLRAERPQGSCKVFIGFFLCPSSGGADAFAFSSAAAAKECRGLFYSSLHICNCCIRYGLFNLRSDSCFRDMVCIQEIFC